MANPLRSFFLIAGERYSKKVQALVDQYNKDLPDEIRPFIEENLWMGRHPNYPKTYINRTNKLYIRTGNLTNALRVNNPANITRVTRRSNTNILEYGIDLRRVPYAQFHETGTSRFRARPFIAPGIKAFRERRLLQLQNTLFRKITNAWAT